MLYFFKPVDFPLLLLLVILVGSNADEHSLIMKDREWREVAY